MTAKKYLICPAHVSSKYDDDWHFIGSRQLIHLYGVNPDECVIEPTGRNRDGYRPDPTLIRLEPRYHGDYSLEAAIDRHRNQRT